MEVIKREVTRMTFENAPDKIGFNLIMDERDWVTLVHQYRTGENAAWHFFFPELKLDHVDLTDNGTMHFVTPARWNDWTQQMQHIWTSTMQRCEKSFMLLMNLGVPVQEAKAVLPSAVAHRAGIVGDIQAWQLLYMHHGKCPMLKNFFRNIFIQLGFEKGKE